VLRYGAINLPLGQPPSGPPICFTISHDMFHDPTLTPASGWQFFVSCGLKAKKTLESMSDKDGKKEGEKEEEEAEEEGVPAHRAQRFDPYAILGLDHNCVSRKASITAIRPLPSAAAGRIRHLHLLLAIRCAAAHASGPLFDREVAGPG
jgi:hypothetical protein